MGNWKAYIERKEDAKKLFALSKRLVGSARRVRVVLAPPSPFLGLLATGNRSRVAFAGQDVSLASVGAATGEVTAGALYDAGARYAIVGHSERRAMGETDANVAEKVKHALRAGLTPILCVGEKERDEDALYLSYIRRQIDSVYSALTPRERIAVIVAYEPVWAIGKRADDAMDPADLQEMVLYIRKVLGDYLPSKTAQKTIILYGGSAEPANVRELAEGSKVDGFLVGHASADPTMFGALVKALTT